MRQNVTRCSLRFIHNESRITIWKRWCIAFIYITNGIKDSIIVGARTSQENIQRCA
jgi:hypothetical protein